MSTLARRRYSYEDYLAVEALSEVQHEYLDGEIFAMAGGSPTHAALASTLLGILYRQLAGGSCRAYGSDLRVRIETTGLSTYPDASVVCEPMTMAENDPNAATNPTLLFEVLSPSTEGYDRGDKRLHYQEMKSVQAIVFVHQNRPEVEAWHRAGDGFTQERCGPKGSVRLAHGVELPIEELYAGIRFPS